MSTVKFPPSKDVIRDVEIHKSVQKIKKNCFMNGCDTNYTYGKVKEGIIDDPKVLKRLKWVKNLDKAVQRKIGERIKIKPQEVPNPEYNPGLFYALQLDEPDALGDTIMEDDEDDSISSRISFLRDDMPSDR